MTHRQVFRKRRVKKNVENGVAHIRSTFNNTVVTITDEFGSTLSWSSIGALGFKGSKESTPFTAQMASEATSKSAVEHGLETVGVTVKRPGPSRESAIRALQSADLEVAAIGGATPVPRNSCHPPRRRRIWLMMVLLQVIEQAF